MATLANLLLVKHKLRVLTFLCLYGSFCICNVYTFVLVDVVYAWTINSVVPKICSLKDM